ncbi:hypothetical protein J7T55_006321 [Diaporthe amygdali]|uniref:uncharacterized protein n=1 Tax=Phomopsis amygdali TaxID=1214568 RepID=UPI0022FEAA4B|nr:uncharacterized protein J7T55_006321 [Diaporthe amygdali]KAJ0124978.1 hypothetical protein J7T55_006321 [Diaporthe amygdali]
MLSESEIAKDIHDIEDGKPSRRSKLPSELSFEQVVKNTTAPPCSLGEFMDFLVYENRNAELLQFFIWYCDYIERWSELSPQQKSLSPPWEPDRQRGQKGLAAQTHRRDGSDRLNQILNIMEVVNSRKHPNWSLGTSETRVSSGITMPLNSNPIDEQASDQRQPFRDEVNMIIKQYITNQAPRRLDISDEDLAACQKAASITTHPSALLRAFTAAEDLLKSDCYPRFVRNSQRNANKPRLIFVRVIALIIIMIGFLANQVLVLSSLSQFYRVLSIILWWPSFTILIAAIQGLCLLLQIRSLRQLRPWEQEQLDEEVDADDHGHELNSAAEVTTHISSDNDRRRSKQPAFGTAIRVTSRLSSSRNDDPLRKPSMQTFGPANKYRRRAFVKAYQAKPLTRKIWDDAVKTRNRNIKMLQDRTVFLSICWGGALSDYRTWKMDHPDNQQQAPLISNRDREEDYEDGLDDAVGQAASLEAGKASSPGLFMWLLTFSAGIGGLLFGYDTGVISATLVSIDTSLSNRPLTSFDKSVITSATALFALLISPASSVLADRLGRKRVILLADLLFVLGSALQASSATVSLMIVGRAVVGAAVGAASFVVPLYLAELSPAAFRGRVVTMNIFFVTLGQVVAYVVGWAFAEFAAPETGWRWMVGLGAAPAALQLALVAGMPETPRWLVKAGRVGEARAVVRRVAGSGPGAGAEADVVLKDIEAEVREEEQAQKARRRSPALAARSQWLDGWDELLAVRRNRRALAIACLLQGLQQLCGFNSLMYFSATIFKLLGFDSPTLTSMVVAVTNMLFTVVALMVIDKVGRRRILLYSIPFMILGLLLSAWGFSMMKLSTSTFGDDTSGAPPSPAPASNHGAAVVILTSIMLYVAAYAIGLGNVPWMQSELFSLSVRSLGSGAATATCWAANFVVGLSFLPLMDALSPTWTFVLYAAVCVAGNWMVYRVYPETNGLSLEEAAALLERDDWGVDAR